MIFGPTETRACYMDARHLTGGMVELHGLSGHLDLYRMVSERAANWDGKDILVGM